MNAIFEIGTDVHTLKFASSLVFRIVASFDIILELVGWKSIKKSKISLYSLNSSGSYKWKSIGDKSKNLQN